MSLGKLRLKLDVKANLANTRTLTFSLNKTESPALAQNIGSKIKIFSAFSLQKVSQELRFYNEKSRKLDQEMNALKPEVKVGFSLSETVRGINVMLQWFKPSDQKLEKIS